MKRGVWVLVAALSCAACGGSQGDAHDAATQGIIDANRRLAGPWILESFQPQVALEPMLATLLEVQMGKMRVEFDGIQGMTANGVGVTVTRRYEVVEAYGNHLKVVTYDDRNIPYEAVGEFQGNQLLFESRSSPWQGRGSLVRTQ